MRLISLLSIAWFWIVPSLASAAAPAGVRYPLYDGHGLEQWIVTGCQAAEHDGKLVLESGNGFVRALERYGDFVLELEWRALKPSGYDSGILIRAELPQGDAPWPSRYQINLKQGQEGNLLKVPGGTSMGLVKHGEWNHFKLTAVGSRAELEINGQPAWKTDGLPTAAGYLGLQSEVPEGGQFEFRNIYITELDHRSLFDGHDLAGWEPATPAGGNCWRADGGLLECTGQKGTWLRSQEQFADFNLRLDYKLLAAGNSGVYIRVPADGNHHGPGAGIEVQVLDDQAPKYTKLKPYQFTGSLYAVAAANPRVARPAGEWNTLEIDCRGTRYRIEHNGIVVLDVTADQVPGLGERRSSGYLGLQNHNERVWYRNLRIGKSYE